MVRMGFVFLVSLYTCMVSAQYSVSGKITDESGTPLTGANVILKNSEKGTSSGLKGEFVIKNVSAGNDTVVISYVGYRKYKAPVELSKDVHLDVKLQLSSILGDEVMVRATRAENSEPVAYTDVNKKDLKSRNLGQDIPILLSLTPSFVTTSDAGAGVGYTGFRIRGSDATRINVTINGIPLNDAESQGTYWVDLPDLVSSVDNIQIQRGVGTSTNGAGAFGASINLQTNTLEKDPYTEINSSAGSFNTFKNTVKVGSGLLKDHFSFDVRLSKISSDGYIDRAWSDLKSFFVSGGYYSENTVVKINIFSGLEHTYQAWNGVPSYLLDSARTYNSCGEYTDKNGNVQYYDNQTDNYQQDYYQFFFSHRFGNYLTVNAALHYTYGRGYYEEYVQDGELGYYLLDNVRLGDTTISSSDLIRQKWLDNGFYGTTFSASYKKDRSDLTLGGAWNEYDGRHFGKVIWARFMSNGDKGHVWYRGSGVKTDFNIYGKYNYLLADGLNAYLDMQYRRVKHDIGGKDENQRLLDQSHTFDFFNPKVGLNYSLRDIHVFHFLFAVGNREPNRDNYKDAGPDDPPPTSEQMSDYEAGYDLHLKNFSTGVNFYYMKYRDQLILTGRINDVGNPIMTNVPRSYRTGIEYTVSWNIVKDLQWAANATVSSNKIMNFTEYVDEYDTSWSWIGQRADTLGKTDIAFSPAVIANSRLQYSPFSGFNVSLITQFVGKQYIDNTSNNDRKLDSYLVNKLNFQYSFRLRNLADVELHFLINNLFNTLYENNAWVYSYYFGGVREQDNGYYPQAGVNFLGGVTLRF